MSKRILVVPDIHGEPFWKEPVLKYIDQVDIDHSLGGLNLVVSFGQMLKNMPSQTHQKLMD